VDLFFGDVQFPAHQLAGQAGVLASATDGNGQIFFVHFEVDAALSLIELDVPRNGGLDCFAQKIDHILAPRDNINLLTPQFAHDTFDPRTA